MKVKFSDMVLLVQWVTWLTVPTVFTSVLDDSRNVSHGREGCFFLRVEEVKGFEYFNGIARILFELGKIESNEPRPLGEDEAVEYWGPSVRIYRFKSFIEKN